jgi:hypothetical protein
MLKAAAVVAAGAVTAGVGYQSVTALTASPAPATAAMKARPTPVGKNPAAAKPIRTDVSASGKKLRRAAPSSTRPDRFARPTTFSQPPVSTGGALAPSAAPAVQVAAPPPVASGVPPTPVPPAPLPSVPLPPAPVPVPPVVPLPPVQVTPPPVPPLPIRVTIPPLPPPPIK